MVGFGVFSGWLENWFKWAKKEVSFFNYMEGGIRNFAVWGRLI